MSLLPVVIFIILVIPTILFLYFLVGAWFAKYIVKKDLFYVFWEKDAEIDEVNINIIMFLWPIFTVTIIIERLYRLEILGKILRIIIFPYQAAIKVSGLHKEIV